MMRASSKKSGATKASKTARPAHRQPARPTPATPPAPVKPGRPSKCTPELTGQLVAHIRAGSYLSQAAQACGVHSDTLRSWINRGEAEWQRLNKIYGDDPDEDTILQNQPLESERIFLELFGVLKRAEAEAEVRYVGIIFQASSVKAEFKGQWTAAAWWLERHHPERWGRKERIEATQTIDFGARIANIEVVRTSTPGASAEVFDVNGEAESRYAHLVTSTNAEVDELMS